MAKMMDKPSHPWLERLRKRPKSACLLALVATAAFAYRDLIGFDPYANTDGRLSAVDDWFFSPSGSSPGLILALTALFAFARRERLLAGRPTAASIGLGSLVFAAGAGWQLWAVYTSAPDLLIPSLGLVALGVAAMVSGGEGARALALPVAFMVALATPNPPALVNAVVYPLQLFTAEVSVLLLSAMGFSASRSGELIFVGDRVFQVIETCSGLRIIETLIMSAVVYTEMFSRSRKRLFVLLGIAPGLGLFVNQVRVLTIIFNPASQIAAVHAAQGIFMLVVGVLLLAGADSFLDRYVARDPGPRGRSTAFPRRRPERLGRLALVCVTGAAVALVGLGFAVHELERWKPGWSGASRAHRVTNLPATLGSWEMEPGLLAVPERFLGSVRVPQRIHRRYHQGDREVTLFVAVDDRLQRSVSMRSLKTALPGGGWAVAERSRVRLEAAPFEVDALLLQGWDGRRALVYHRYDRVGGLAEETLRALLALERSPLRRPDRGRVIRVSTPVGSGPDATREAHDLLRDFFRSLAPAVDAIEPPPDQRRGDL